MNFDILWTEHIMPLKGKEIFTADENKKNIIHEIANDYLIRISSSGKKSHKIPKTLFADIYERLKKERVITRDQINSDYQDRRSSIVTVILGVLPNVEVKTKPVRLEYNAGLN